MKGRSGIRITWLLVLTIVALFHSQLALAHLASTRFGEFYSGILHPITSLVHVIPWLAIGMLGGLHNYTTGHAAATVKMIGLFPLSVFLGLLMGSLFSPVVALHIINLLSFLVVGLLIVSMWPVRPATLLPLTMLLGACHGYANAAEGLSLWQWTLYAAGVTFVAYAVYTISGAVTLWLTKRFSWGTVAIRTLGSWILAIGLMSGGMSLTTSTVI